MAITGAVAAEITAQQEVVSGSGVPLGGESGFPRGDIGGE
jgi:hypothetical protein